MVPLLTISMCFKDPLHICIFVYGTPMCRIWLILPTDRCYLSMTWGTFNWNKHLTIKLTQCLCSTIYNSGHFWIEILNFVNLNSICFRFPNWLFYWLVLINKFVRGCLPGSNYTIYKQRFMCLMPSHGISVDIVTIQVLMRTDTLVLWR